MTSRMSRNFVFVEKEPWLLQFENEPINDGRWSCVVAAAVEAKLEDEECLELFKNHAVTLRNKKNCGIQVITMSDVIKILRNDNNSASSKMKVLPEVVKKPMKNLSNNLGNVSLTCTRQYSEVLSLISKYATYTDDECQLPPELMAYALKYLILNMKNIDCIQRKVNITIRRKKREAEIRSEVIRSVSLGSISQESFKIENLGNSSECMAHREAFDIFSRNSPEPFGGPELYVMLIGFYNPLCFVYLQKILVPFMALIKVECVEPIISSDRETPKKLEYLSNFWKELENQLEEEETTVLYKDIAMLSYSTKANGESSSDNGNCTLIHDLSAMLYSVYHLFRLHQSYIYQTKVYSIIESLEPLDLSTCRTYGKLCNNLIMENFNAEVFVLFAIVEQVVEGVPKTRGKIVEYVREQCDFFEMYGSSLSDSTSLLDLSERSSSNLAETDENEIQFFKSYYEEITRDREKNITEMDNPEIYFFDDLISLHMCNVDQRILKSSVIFDRFITNSIISKIRGRYPKLTKAEAAECEFQFFRLCKRNEDCEESFKLKLFFTIAMKLIRRTRSYADCHRKEVKSAEKVVNFANKVDRPVVLENVRSDLASARFQEVLHFFYKPLPDKESSEVRKSSLDAKIPLKKAQAYSVLSARTSSLENLQMACGRKCSSMPTAGEKPRSPSAALTNLAHFLDSSEVAVLNEPNLLVDPKNFQAFVGKHNFYEMLEPNRTAQRLQEIYDNCNEIEYTYFSPTDTLFVLGLIRSDSEGLSFSEAKGFIESPLSLRDFVSYVLPKHQKWVSEENVKYIEFLNEVREKIAAKVQRKDHEYRCNLLKMFYSMTESQRKNYLEDLKISGKSKNANLSETTMAENGMRKVNRSEKDEEEKSNEVFNGSKIEELDDLPPRIKFPRPENYRFYGFNFKNIRTEVDESRSEFHSKDGSSVYLRTESWLYNKRFISLIISRMGSKFYCHFWNEGDTAKEKYHFTDASKVVVTFPFQDEWNHVQHLFRRFCRIVWPTGLLIEVVPLSQTMTYIKQNYLHCYQQKDGMKTENFRCYLPNGQVLIFHVDGMVTVLCPSGTIYDCYEVGKPSREKVKKECNLTKNGEMKNKIKLTPNLDAQLEIEKYDILTPTGEFYRKDKYSPYRKLKRTVNVLVGIDPMTRETYHRREDGTSYMLWSDGKLVTMYPDGTKITSLPEFEDNEIYAGEDEENGLFGKGSSVVILPEESEGNTVPEETNINFVYDVRKSNNGFVSVACSYLLENPRYATVYIKSLHMTLKMVGGMSIVAKPTGTFVIATGGAILKTSKNSFSFYNTCKDCGKKSISKVNLDRGPGNENLLCETQDFYGNKFFVYDTGKIFHEKEETRAQAPDICKIDKMPSQHANADNQPRENKDFCHHGGEVRPFEKCLVIQRNLTGIEFIHYDSLSKFVHELSEEAHYDLGRPSKTSEILQHSFFDPIYAVGKEKYRMTYECNDVCSLRVKRKDLKPLKKAEYVLGDVPQTFRINCIFNIAARSRKQPKAIVQRVIRVLHADPIAVMKHIHISVTLYQKKASEILEMYSNLSRKKNQIPFSKHVAKEILLIAETLCRNLHFYTHTSTIIPSTETDIHLSAHSLSFNENLVNRNLSDFQDNVLPECIHIPKPLKHKGRGREILELSS